ncbi:hypothetical protein BHE74_00055547 [Ensete ventricosum]|nr:hypothetical protein BHE74_00055547 [Ensete ventricosum]
MPRLLIIIVATLRHRSMTLGLVVMDVATTRHGSRTPRWLGEAATTGDRLVVAEVAGGEESGLGEHGQCLRMSPAGELGVEASLGALVHGFGASTSVLVLGFGATTGTTRLPLFLGACDGVTDVAGVVVYGTAVAFEGVEAGGVDIAG